MPSAHHPGGGHFYLDHAEALAEQGYRVDILLNRIIDAARFKISDLGCLRRFSVSSRNGVRHIHSCYRRHPYQALKNLRDWTKSTVQLYERYRKKYGDPSVILVFSAVWTGYAASEISRLYGVPYVITEHRSRFTSLRQEALEMIKEPHLPFLESAFSGASEIISVSDSLLPSIKKYAGEKEILTIPNLVKTDFFVPPETRQQDPFVILAAARLESEKGIDLLIQAFDLFASDNPDSELRIIGKGPVEQDLKTMASRTIDPERIRFLGSLSRKDMLKEMQNASVLAVTSRFEAFGLVIAEAMSTGLPILATRSGGPIDIVPSYAGILVDCESVPAVFVGLKNIYSRYPEFHPDKSRKHAIKSFGEKVVMKCYKLVLDTVISQERAPQLSPETNPQKSLGNEADKLPEQVNTHAPEQVPHHAPDTDPEKVKKEIPDMAAGEVPV